MAAEKPKHPAWYILLLKPKKNWQTLITLCLEVFPAVHKVSGWELFFQCWCCRHKGVHLGQGHFIGKVEHNVRFKQCIKCSQGAGSPSADEPFVYNDVVSVSPVLCCACSKEIQLLSSPQVAIKAAAWLQGTQYHNKTVMRPFHMSEGKNQSNHAIFA